MKAAFIIFQLVLLAVQLTLLVISIRRRDSGLTATSSLLSIPQLLIAFVVVPSL